MILSIAADQDIAHVQLELRDVDICCRVCGGAQLRG